MRARATSSMAAWALSAMTLGACQLISGATEKTFVEPAVSAQGGASGQGGQSGEAGASGQGGLSGEFVQPPVVVQRSKVDLLLVVDNSSSMADKQQLLAKAVDDMIDRLLYPPCINSQGVQRAWEAKPCPEGSTPAFAPLRDLHLGVVTSSLGGHGADICEDVDEAAPNQTTLRNFTKNDRGRLIRRGPRVGKSDPLTFAEVATRNDEGFLVFAPDAGLEPPGETVETLKQKARELVLGAEQVGCGYEAPLEAWYRFLVDPTPPGAVRGSPLPTGPITVSPAEVEGVDRELLAQREAFLRPDSLVGILLISDENDCSVIDGVLPATVCDVPTTGPGSVTDDGLRTGCAEARRGWPRGYVEGNFDGVTTDAEGRVTGTPFAANRLALMQEIRLYSGTPACEQDPFGPSCRQCYGTGETSCVQLERDADPQQQRCWDQKRRFGVDMLYPIQRYLDGLKSPTIYDREGFQVPNPLFVGDRTEKDIFFAAIVGVPWQDMARDPEDLTRGYKPSVGTGEMADVSVDWGLIVGDPLDADPERQQPRDTLMRESRKPRSGVHPITGETIGLTPWNRINGHERPYVAQDLQYACIFDLPTPSTCDDPADQCDCGDDPPKAKNPLCEEISPGGVSTFSSTQRRAKAYPAPRVLQLVKGLGAQGVVTSICTPNTTKPELSDYAYRPATRLIADTIAMHLKAE